MNRRILFIGFFIFAGIWLEGCGLQKVTKPEAKRRAEAQFVHICTIPYSVTTNKQYFKTNEFIGPKLIIGKGEVKNELCFSYIWTHKSANYQISVGVTESGNIAGGGGPISFREKK